MPGLNPPRHHLPHDSLQYLPDLSHGAKVRGSDANRKWNPVE